MTNGVLRSKESRCASAGRRTFRLLFAFFLFTIVLSPHLFSQSEDDGDDEVSPAAFASLAVSYNVRGDATVTFDSFGITQNLPAIRDTLEHALHCPAGSLVNPPSRGLPSYLKSRPLREQQRYQEYNERWRMNSFRGSCPAAMSRAGLLLSTDISLVQLNDEFKRAGVQSLWVRVSYPKSRFSEHSAAGKTVPEPRMPSGSRSVRAELFSSFTTRVTVGEQPPGSIHLAFGLRRQDAIRAAILPAVILLLPIIVCFWMRRAAIRDANIDPVGAWFSYFRVLTWSGMSLLLIWMVGQTVRKGLEDITAYYTAAHSVSAVALMVGILIMPPWLAYLICLLISYKVYVQVRGEKWTRWEFLASHTLAIGSLLLPLMFLLAAFSMIAINGQVSCVLFFCVYASYKLCSWLNVKITKEQPEPLSTGELRDRVFELARKAAVELRQVSVMPARKSQMANAFASRNHHIFFTDYLLRHLNKREVVAVAAHEVTHIQKRHSTWMGIAFVALIFSPEILFGILSSIVGYLRHSLEMRQVLDGAGAAAGLAALVRFGDQALAFPEIILILYVFTLTLFYLMSRYMETVADTGAVQLSGDPEAVITGLLKLNRQNLMPVQWDRVTGSLFTHPSTLKRVQRVATIAQITPARLEQLLRETREFDSQSSPKEDSELNERFTEAAPRDPVITAMGTYDQLAYKKWVLRFVYIASPGLVAIAVRHYHVRHPALAYLLGGIACFIPYLLVSEWQNVWGRKHLRVRFLSRLEEEGIEAPENSADLITASPHASLRGYDLGYNWDSGFLFFAKNRLCYVGDQIRFALTPDQLIAVRRGSGIPEWIPKSRIYIDWQVGSDAPLKTWNISPSGPCLFWLIRRQVRDLQAKLLRWKSEPSDWPDANPHLNGLLAPAIGEVTSRPIKSVVTFRRFLKVAFLNQILAVVACLMFRIPAIWFVCLIDFLFVTYSFSPFWFRKEAETNHAPAIPPAGDSLPGAMRTGD